MGKFVIKETNTGFVFNLKAGNGEVIAVSEVYTTKSACEKGIQSVAKNAPKANIEDRTVDSVVEQKSPKFEVFVDKKGEFRFRLKAKNGEIIAASEGYTAKSSCINGIESVKNNAESETVSE